MWHYVAKLSAQIVTVINTRLPNVLNLALLVIAQVMMQFGAKRARNCHIGPIAHIDGRTGRHMLRHDGSQFHHPTGTNDIPIAARPPPQQASDQLQLKMITLLSTTLCIPQLPHIQLTINGQIFRMPTRHRKPSECDYHGISSNTPAASSYLHHQNTSSSVGL